MWNVESDGGQNLVDDAWAINDGCDSNGKSFGSAGTHAEKGGFGSDNNDELGSIDKSGDVSRGDDDMVLVMGSVMDVILVISILTMILVMLTTMCMACNGQIIAAFSIMVPTGFMMPLSAVAMKEKKLLQMISTAL